MGKTSLIVSVRMDEADLRRLQLIAQVYEQSVGELIRTGVQRYIKAMTRTRAFRTKGKAILKRNEQMLNELLVAAGVEEEIKK